MRLRYVFSALFLLMLMSATVEAKSDIINEEVIEFEAIGTDEGLIDLSVSGIVQDRDGYIWFATQGGLHKFNGRESHSYRNDPFNSSGLIDNLIQTIYYDGEEHVMWLGTYQGISKLDIASQSFTNYAVEDSNLSNNVIVAIEKDTNGDIWFGTMTGLNRLDHLSGEIEVFDVKGDVVRSLLLDSRGRLLVGTYEGLYNFDRGTNELQMVEIDYPSLFVMAVEEFNPGILTLGMWDGGIMTLDMDFNVLEKISLEDDRVYTLLQTQEGILWAGTWGGGLFSLYDSDIRRFPGEGKRGDIGHSVVYSFFQDMEGVLWIGTNGNGAYRLDLAKENHQAFVNNPDDPYSLDAGKINDIYRDSQGQLWIAVYNKGVNRFDPSTGRMIKYTAENEGDYVLEDNQIMDIMEYNGGLLLGSSDGILVHDEATNNFSPMGVMPDNIIVYAFEVDKDNHLWVGTYLDGVYHFDESFQLLNHFHSGTEEYPLQDDLIYDLECSSDGRMWIASNNGLYVYDEATESLKGYFKEENNEEAIASNRIRSVHEDGAGRLWIGMSGGGIGMFDPASETFTAYTEQEGLINNAVISIKSAENGDVWVATRTGISILNPETGRIINLSDSNSALGNDYTSDGMIDVDGSLYFGGVHGIDRFPAVHEVVETQMPPLYITGVSVYHTPVDSMKRIFNGENFELGSEDNYLSFEFEALNYGSQAGINYSYKLEDIDDGWVEGGTRNFASYSNLNPGSYTFSVRIESLQGVYSEPVSVSFTIAKPWYKTVVAYLAYVMLFAALIYYLWRIRQSRLIAIHNDELSDLNNQLEEAVDALKAVSIRDPLTGIFNRRYFDEVLSDYLQLTKRGDDMLSLIMMDMDDFKEINDSKGHVFGDAFLKALAEGIASSLPRATDFCARFGGDEFAVVLYDTDQVGADAVAVRIMDKVKRMEIITGTDRKFVESSMSIGICTAKPSKSMTIEQLVDCADKMLYKAKENGKGRIEHTETF